MNNNIQEVKISDIKIGDRHRTDMGDIEGLAESIKETDLLQPIGITPNHELVFGERRLLAFRDVMKLETIPARIIEVQSVLHAQIAEDVMRKDYTVSERVAIVEALRSYKHGGDRRSNQDRNCDVELTVDEAAKRAGLGGKDGYARAKKVIDNGVPRLVEAMDKGEIAVSAAAELADAPQNKQQECMKRRFDGGKLTTRAINKQLRRIRNQKDREETLARALKEVDKDDAIQIYHCPFQELESIAGLSSNSVDLLFTDIPYDEPFLDQLPELALLAERVLVDGGLFVSYVGQKHFDRYMKEFGKRLN